MKTKDYFIWIVILLMLVFPALCTIIDFQTTDNQNILVLIGKWFVFWAIGIRLFSAGIKQAINPAFTLEKIFGIKNKESRVIVRELGFANICMGFLGIISLFMEQFRLSAAITGGLYFGLAGLLHVFKKRESENEIIAMISDLLIFIVMIIFVIENL
jgi:hypothetical protein